MINMITHFEICKSNVNLSVPSVRSWLWWTCTGWRRHRCVRGQREKRWSLHVYRLHVAQVFWRKGLCALRHPQSLLYVLILSLLKVNNKNVYIVQKLGYWTVYHMFIAAMDYISCYFYWIVFSTPSASNELQVIRRGLDSFASFSCIRFTARSKQRDYISIEVWVWVKGILDKIQQTLAIMLALCSLFRVCDSIKVD